MKFDEELSKLCNEVLLSDLKALDKLESAVVVHSEKDMSESDMFRGAMDGKWVVKGTSVDADFNMGTQFA